MEGTYKIYCYTCLITGKKYIGQTCLTLERRAGHNGYRYREVHAFGAAIKKHGWENFVGEILEDGLTLGQANEREQYWISELNTLAPNGYNLSYGGNNYAWNELSKQKMSQIMKGRKPWITGGHHSDETKEKIRQSSLGKEISREAVEKLRQANLGSKHTEEQKRKISNSMKGIKRSEETRRKMSESRKGVSTGQNKSYQSKSVLQFTLDGQFVAEYPSTAEVSRKFGINQSNVSSCCRGKRNKAGGYIWKYKEAV